MFTLTKNFHHNSTVVKEYMPYAKVHWHDDINTVRVEYFKLYGAVETWSEIWEYVLNLIEDKKIQIWIRDSYNSNGVFTIEVQNYIRDVLIPEGAKNGIKTVLTIAPKEVGLVSMTNNICSNEVNSSKMFEVTQDFQSLKEVLTWINNNKSLKKDL